MAGLQVYGTVRRVGSVTERAGDEERETEIQKERETGGTCNATYGIGNCWVASLGPVNHLFVKKKLFPFCASRTFSLSIQQHCIFRVKHMRTRHFLLHFPCLFPHFSLRYCFHAGFVIVIVVVALFWVDLDCSLGLAPPDGASLMA